MEVGKLKNEVLGEIVLSEIHRIREDVLIRPGIGEDCAAIAFGDYACVLTTDPITGSGSQLGKLAVHVCLNDIASSGAEPVGLMLTLLCPENTTKDEIQAILKEANQTAKELQDGEDKDNTYQEMIDLANTREGLEYANKMTYNPFNGINDTYRSPFNSGVYSPEMGLKMKG